MEENADYWYQRYLNEMERGRNNAFAVAELSSELHATKADLDLTISDLDRAIEVSSDLGEMLERERIKVQVEQSKMTVHRDLIEHAENAHNLTIKILAFDSTELEQAFNPTPEAPPTAAEPEGDTTDEYETVQITEMSGYGTVLVTYEEVVKTAKHRIMLSDSL